MQTPTRFRSSNSRAQAASRSPAFASTGDISSASKDAIVGIYQALDKDANKHILLDFKGVKYLNSSGIALVIQVLMEASKSGQTIAICGLTPHFTKVFTMVGITKYAALYPDEAASLSAL